MVQKPKIQYVGQFYIHGSAARKLEPQRKQAKTMLPIAKLQKIEKIYVDPVALVGIVVAVIMLVTMVIGAVQLHEDWQEYGKMSSYVSQLKKTNAESMQQFRSMYDLETVREEALSMGMVSVSEVEHMRVTVTIPEPEPEMSKIQETKLFLEGLFAE